MSNITKLIQMTDDGGYLAEYAWQTYRFLLSNGSCFDVQAVRDDSWLRDEILKIANNVDKVPSDNKLPITICGVAEIRATSTERRPVKLPTKKAAKTMAKKATT